MKSGSYFPDPGYSSMYAMAGDDCSLFFDLNELTEKQLQDHRDNQELTACLQVALMCIGNSDDHVALYEDFNQSGWRETLIRYQDFFGRMVGDVVPANHLTYHPRQAFYESVARYLDANPGLTDVANLYMSSGTNSVIHRNPGLLEVSRNVNSKKHFAENAPAYGISVPDTLLTTKEMLNGSDVKAFFDKHNNQLMIKLMGLAGARNVAAVSSVDECRKYVEQYADSMVVLLQEKLDLDFYTEMTVDLFVSDDDIHIANVRKILFANGLWVGNLIGRSVELNTEQTQELLHVGEYARHHGYTSDLGSNCGIDFFIGKDGSIVVTEINARWTGGLFPAEVLKKLAESRDAVAFFDVVPVRLREAYVDFVDRYLVGSYEGDFAVVPLGFGCFPVTMHDEAYFYTWQAVVGDFEAFKQVKNEQLGERALRTADLITL